MGQGKLARAAQILSATLLKFLVSVAILVVIVLLLDLVNTLSIFKILDL